MSCKDCRGSGGTNIGSGSQKLRVDDVWKLYNPTLGGPIAIDDSYCGKRSSKGLTCGKTVGRCGVCCALPRNCVDQFKQYWNKNCDIPLVRFRAYENQPWFQNRIVQDEWEHFVSQLVTPFNIGCQACPGPDDWQFKCHKARALIGPTIPCVWELPEQDPCDCTQYGINRDWRRYNVDQRVEASDIVCGCNNEPVCCPKPRCEWPPYLGCPYGPRYMAWSHPLSMNFPRPQVFNYQSLPKC